VPVRWKPKTILITGATGGIGSALALEYAAPDISLLLFGRNRERLGDIAGRCRRLGSQVTGFACDILERDRFIEQVREVCGSQAVDLVIACAGINTNIGVDGSGECWKTVEELIEVNVLAAMATAHAAIPSMRRRGKGQIALISSLAAYHGLPVTPSYSASKAAIKTYGESLRGWLEPEGIKVNVIMPGYVESEMCRAMPGPKPFLCSAEKAARKIRKGLLADRPRITFPFPLDLGGWLLSVLPPGISGRILRLLGYGG
jgi:short-subunit dehydrogenase